ncbi:MAG: hypothetical protein ACTSW1_07610 [Candidatus Hodarchaeales archaeon]
MNELCKGCKWFPDDTVGKFNNCAIKRYNTMINSNRSSCPCLECLVKSMCRIKCQKRIDHFSQVLWSTKPNGEGAE